MQDDAGKREPIEQDPDALIRLLDLQLKQKRAERPQTSAHHRNIRAASFLLLLVIFAGALFAFLFLFSQANEQRSNSRKPVNSTEVRR